MTRKNRTWLISLTVVLLGGVAVGALIPTVQAAQNALPYLRHAQMGWIGAAVLCQCAMYAALAGVLQAGLGASESGESDTQKGKSRPGFWFLWAVGAAFLWTSRALPGPALAGIATLTFLLSRKTISASASQAVAATFFLADYVSFFGLGLVLFGTLAFQNRLTHLHPGLLVLGMGIIAVGLAGVVVLLRLPDFAANLAEKSARFAARLARRPPETQTQWGQKSAEAMRLFYARWQEITARRRTLWGATVCAALMHLAETATVFCAARAFGAGGMQSLAEASGAGYVAGNIAAIVSFLPAGLGFFEGAMGTTLHYLGGLTPAQSTLATLLYRLLSVGLPMPFVIGAARHAVKSLRKPDAKKNS